MHHLVSVPLDPKVAEYMGKRGSQNSITFYDRKTGGDTIVAMAPTSIGEKFYAAAESMMLAEQVVMGTANPDRLFGEVLLGCALLKKRVIFTDDTDVDQLVGGSGILDYEKCGKEELLDRITKYRGPGGGGAARVDIDKAFPVKGLGTVALGIVTSGTVRKHDELHHSSGKMVSVRSIQSQDVDVDEAETGTRLGMVLKGIEHDEIVKGDLLTHQPSGKVRDAKISMELGGIAKESVAAGNRYYAVSNFTYTAVKVESTDGTEAVVSFEKAVALLKGDSLLMLRDRIPRIFALGRVL